jgi:hypothetical protein
MQQCEQHKEIVKYQGELFTKLAVMQNTLDSVKDRICLHIDEGEKHGGFRDRVLTLEQTQKALKEEIGVIKRSYWKTCLVAGVLGGLLGKLTPDLFNLIIRMVVA